jgi:hypothetical protein
MSNIHKEHQSDSAEDGREDMSLPEETGGNKHWEYVLKYLYI